MSNVLALLNLLLSTVLLVVLIRNIVRHGMRISTISLLVFVITNVIGISFVPIILKKELLNTGSVMLPFQPGAYTAQVISAAIFVLASFCFLYISHHDSKLPSHLEMKRKMPGYLWFVGGFVFLIGVALWLKYMLFGSGLNIALSTKYGFFDFSQSAASRAEAKEILQAGQGYFRALIASYSIFPLSVAMIRLFGRCKVFFFFTWTTGTILSLLFAVSTRQKAPPMIVIVCFIAILAVSEKQNARIKDIVRKRRRKRIVIGIVVVFLLSSFFYYVTQGESFVISMQKVILRIFVTPAATAHLWYIAFPARFPFQGISNVFLIRSPTANDGSAITIQDIAFETTGSVFSANASFLAMGWSGLGYIGIFLGIIAFLSFLRIMDRATCRLNGLPMKLIFCLMIPGFPPLMSSSLMDMVFIGTIPAILFFALSLRVRIKGMNL